MKRDSVRYTIAYKLASAFTICDLVVPYNSGFTIKGFIIARANCN